MSAQEIIGLFFACVGLIGLFILFVFGINEDDKRRKEDIKLKKELISKIDDIDTRLFHIALCQYVKKETKVVSKNDTRSKTK